MQALINKTIGNFKLTKILSENDLVSLFQGFQIETREKRMVLVCGGKKIPEEHPIRKRFRDVAYKAAMVRHSALVPVIEFGQERQYDFLVQAIIIEGQTLEQRIEKDGHLPFHDSIDLVIEVIRGLIAATIADIAEALIEAEGVTLTASGNVKLTRILDPTQRVQYQDWGINPSQFIGKPIPERHHLIAIGALFYHLITGSRRARHKWKIETIRSIESDSLLKDMPALLKEFLKKILENAETNFPDLPNALEAFQELKRQISTTSSKPIVEKNKEELHPIEKKKEAHSLTFATHAQTEELIALQIANEDISIKEENTPPQLYSSGNKTRRNTFLNIFIGILSITAIASGTFFLLRYWMAPNLQQTASHSNIPAIANEKVLGIPTTIKNLTSYHEHSAAWKYAIMLEQSKKLAKRDLYGKALQLIEQFSQSDPEQEWKDFAGVDARRIQAEATFRFKQIKINVAELKSAGKEKEAAALLDNVIHAFGIPELVKSAKQEKELLLTNSE